MNRKKRKQLRKKKPINIKWIEEVSRAWAEACKKLPPRPHQNNKVIVDGKVGCIPFATPFGYKYCEDCDSVSYCSKQVKWIITKGKFCAR